MESFVLKGDICYSGVKDRIHTSENSYLVCENGLCSGVFEALPETYSHLPLHDFSGKVIIPGLCDMHLHAPQYTFRGLGMDMGLLEWLKSNAFPEEARYESLEYAKAAYSIFVNDLKHGATTRAAIFATIHGDASELLMDITEESGIIAYIGKVNMDRNAPSYLCESSAESSARATVKWVRNTLSKYKNVKPILTPRFIPSCSDELMEMLMDIQREYSLPVQSHISENEGEVAWVSELCPSCDFYAEAYDRFGLFGGDVPTIMAHCVLSQDAEIALMKERGVYAAHCPQSNTNLASGIAPVRRYIDEGLNVCLGSDIAGGSSMSIFRAMVDAVQASKLRFSMFDNTLKPLTMPEAFYLATVGGGSFFGKVGKFEKGFEFDAVVIDEKRIPSPRRFTLHERLERIIYLSCESDIISKYVKGKKLF